VKYPRVLLQAETAQERTRWRVVVDQREDGNGILREVRFIETADAGDKDALGTQRWQQLTMKTGQSTWMLVCESAIELIFKKE